MTKSLSARKNIWVVDCIDLSISVSSRKEWDLLISRLKRGRIPFRAGKERYTATFKTMRDLRRVIPTARTSPALEASIKKLRRSQLKMERILRKCRAMYASLNGSPTDEGFSLL